jgi:hypothetical protein
MRASNYRNDCIADILPVLCRLPAPLSVRLPVHHRGLFLFKFIVLPAAQSFAIVSLRARLIVAAHALSVDAMTRHPRLALSA